MVSAHETFHSILYRALSAHDRVIREEETKASALLKVRGAMDSLEHLFDMAKEFYVAEPSRDALAAVCFMFGNQAFQDTVDENILQDVLIQTADVERPAKHQHNDRLPKFTSTNDNVGRRIDQDPLDIDHTGGQESREDVEEEGTPERPRSIETQNK